MAKYAGSVGYATQVKKSPGIWSDSITEVKVFGDIIGQGSSTPQGEPINDDIFVQHRISIVADPYAMSNYFNLKYATLWNTKWKVTGVEVQRPRLILTLGGLYNG